MDELATAVQVMQAGLRRCYCEHLHITVGLCVDSGQCRCPCAEALLPEDDCVNEI